MLSSVIEVSVQAGSASVGFYLRPQGYSHRSANFTHACRKDTANSE
jgi:hypothetical protein